MAKKTKQMQQVKPEFFHLILDDTSYKTLPIRKYTSRKKYQRKDDSLINAIIPGIIGKIYVKEGDEVHHGDKLLELEAMKMYNQILSPLNGKVKKISVASGDKVTKDQLLIEIEPFTANE